MSFGLAGESWLIADIGGTHARFAQSDGHQLEAQHTLSTSEFPGLEEAVEAYFQYHQQEPLRRVILALPCPVNQDPIVLTNAGWRIRRDRLRQRFGLHNLVLMNDFQAQAMALPHLAGADVHQIHAGVSRPQGNRVVLGPGTGLGVAGLVWAGDHWVPVTGEGGHVTLPAMNDLEDDILRAARRQIGHVSAEKLISGIGLSTLEHCMAQVAGDATYHTRSSREIVSAASNGEACALETVHQMLAFLATVSADLALSYGALGGVYLAGGILPRLRQVAQWPAFHRRFVAKGRFEDYLQRIPLQLITHEQPGLLGLMTMIRDAEQA